MIALLDYGAGNLASVRKALAAIGLSVYTPRQPAELERAAAIVVPGVGHFAATGALGDAWRGAVRAVLDGGRPLLGICLGLQWLFEGSDEAPGLCGLGLFAGRCARLKEGREAAGTGEGGVGARLKVPHVGWNALAFPRPSRLFAGVPAGAYVYFTHSYAAPIVGDTVAVCEHGVPFTAAVERGPVAAVQFHPEKSGAVGLRVLRNWFEDAVRGG